MSSYADKGPPTPNIDGEGKRTEDRKIRRQRLSVTGDPNSDTREDTTVMDHLPEVHGEKRR